MTVMTLDMMQLEARKISFATRVASAIYAFAKSISDKINARVVKSLARDTIFIEKQIALVPSMSADQVKVGQIFISRILPVLDRLDRRISKMDDRNLAATFKQHKKAVFKFESKLHQKAMEGRPVIATDEELQKALYNASILSVTSQL